MKIAAQDLEHAIASIGLYVVRPNDDLEVVKESTMEDMKSVMSGIDKTGEWIYVQASTLGSLEALLEFLKTHVVNIPVSGIGIGPVHKKDVMKATVMLEKKKEYATILAFDVKMSQEARDLAQEYGVKVFTAGIMLKYLMVWCESIFSYTSCRMQRYRREKDWVNALFGVAIAGAAVSAGTRNWKRVASPVNFKVLEDYIEIKVCLLLSDDHPMVSSL